MSPKPYALRAYAKASPLESLVNTTGSYNRYYASSADSDFESDWDLLASETKEAILARFWSSVDKNGPIPAHRPALGPCWVWTGSLNHGYGQLTFPRRDGKQPHVYAHRFIYERTYGPLPATQPNVCHACDRPSCVRASHLFAGTQYDNLTDARRKGRLVDGIHSRKISDDAVADIRATYRPRVNGKALAAKYGITLVHVLRLVRGTSRPPVPAGERGAHVQLEPVPFRQIPIRGQVA